MEDVLPDIFDKLKVSAFSKSKYLSTYITNVSIGPSSTISKQSDDKGKIVNPEKHVTTKTFLPDSKLDVFPIRKIINELENQRQEYVQAAVNSHRDQIIEFSKKQECIRKEQSLKRQQKILENTQQQELSIFQTLQEHDKDASDQHQKLVQYYQDLAEKRKKQDEILRVRAKKKQVISAIVEHIKKDQMEFRKYYQDIAALLKNSAVHGDIKSHLGDIAEKLKMLPEGMDEIVCRCKTGKISMSEAQKADDLVQQIRNLKAVIEKKLTDIVELQRSSEQKKREKEVVERNDEVKDNSVKISTEASVKAESPSVEDFSSRVEYYVGKTSLKMYCELQSFLQSYTNGLKELLENSTYKQFRFDCKKAVNIPVNAISAVSSQHLLDKYYKLSNLLRGNMVEVGGTQVNATKHPQGLAFCMDLLARKFVLQGDLMISSNPEAAFCYAAVIIALWNDFPDFGKLLLAHFYEECPYLVPIYSPRAQGQSDQEYYRSLGYKYVDGVIEKQDKFLKRMTGIMRLYTAILITKPKREQSSNSPHGLSQGWRWITGVLNLEPRSDITATMLHTFFEIGGFSMESSYRKMFKKLIVFIFQKYMPLLQKIDSGGPVTRLEVLLLEYKEKGCFAQPQGLLPNGFW